MAVVKYKLNTRIIKLYYQFWIIIIKERQDWWNLGRGISSYTVKPYKTSNLPRRIYCTQDGNKNYNVKDYSTSFTQVQQIVRDMRHMEFNEQHIVDFSIHFYKQLSTNDIKAKFISNEIWFLEHLSKKGLIPNNEVLLSLTKRSGTWLNLIKDFEATLDSSIIEKCIERSPSVIKHVKNPTKNSQIFAAGVLKNIEAYVELDDEVKFMII